MVDMRPREDLSFLHVSRAYLIGRDVTALDGTVLSEVAALGLTSLDATRARSRAIAGLVRGQWVIESVHWVRDTLYREDESTVRIVTCLTTWAPSAGRLCRQVLLTMTLTACEGLPGWPEVSASGHEHPGDTSLAGGARWLTEPRRPVTRPARLRKPPARRGRFLTRRPADRAPRAHPAVVLGHESCT